MDKNCPECGSYNVYVTRAGVGADGYAEPVCDDCGHYFVALVEDDK